MIVDSFIFSCLLPFKRFGVLFVFSLESMGFPYLLFTTMYKIKVRAWILLRGLVALDCLVTTRKKQLTPLYYVAIDKVMAAHARRSVVSFSFRVT